MDPSPAEDYSLPGIAEATPEFAMTEDDPENPQNWPIYRKVYVSFVGFAFVFAVAFGITAYTSGISGVAKRFDVSRITAILGMSLYLFGIAISPIHTPHWSERFGRSPVYMVCVPIWMLFVLGAGLAQNFGTLAVCRFFAGLFGGPCLVLIEGTFADVWPVSATGTYYSFLTMASYLGAGCGPLVGGFVFAAESWRWTQWITLMVGLAAYLLGIGLPETYHRKILRRKAKLYGVSEELPEADSGRTLRQMTQITFLTPLKMLVTEPIVILISWSLGFNFAVRFQFFVTVPIALHRIHNFDIQQVGLAFIAAIVGALLAALTAIILDRIMAPRAAKKSQFSTFKNIEYRLYPAMIGSVLMAVSLFWIGWTNKPTISWVSPVLGSMTYVWGSAMMLIGFISYLFDAYPARGSLSALTAVACTRVSFAGWLPLVAIQMFMGLTPPWALSTFGFIAIAMIPFPFLLFKFGARFRARSKYAQGSEQSNPLNPIQSNQSNPEMSSIKSNQIQTSQ